jgi:hypothetical protein
MATFGFYSGAIDYWAFVTDWRNGSVALVLLAIGALILRYAFKTAISVPERAEPVLPVHASPAVGEGDVEQDLAADRRAPAKSGIMSGS